MKLIPYTLLAIATIANGLQIYNKAISLDGSSTRDLDITHSTVKVSFKLLKEDREKLDQQPKQVSVLLSSKSHELNSYFYPNYDSKAAQYNAKIPVSKISKYLKTADSISLSVLVGDSDKENNLIEDIGELYPTENLKESIAYEEPVRFGPKPEIIHQFRAKEKYVNPVIALTFSINVIGLLFGLFFFWVKNDALNSNNIIKLPIGYTISFVGCIALFEVTFVDYYLGASIFTTIYRALGLGLATIYLGSKTLRGLYYLREAGLR